jgi:hypothetical protein
MKRTLGILLLLSQAPALANHYGASRLALSEQAEPTWQSYLVAEDDKLVVRLLVLTKASPADEAWMQLHLENRSGAPLEITRFYFGLQNRETFDVSTGRLISSGSLGSMSGHELFIELSPEEPRRPWILPQGVTRASEHISNCSTGLLRMPSPQGWRIRARAHLRVVY